MLSIYLSVSCIKVVAGMIGEEWEGGMLPCKWKASLLFFSSPWKLDLGRMGEVKELGVIEKWNVFSFLFRKNVSFSKRKHNQNSLLLKKILFKVRPQHRKSTKISVLFHWRLERFQPHYCSLHIQKYILKNQKNLVTFLTNATLLCTIICTILWKKMHTYCQEN